MLPADWQVRFVEMVRGAAPLEGTWFAGGQGLSPVEQIGVYRDQFRMRLGESLSAELPGLSALVGEPVSALIEAFLLDHPPSSWSLDHAARPFAGWLRDRGAPEEQVEMAALDRAVAECFLAADAEPVPLEALHPDAVFRLAPSARRLRLRFDVHRFRSEALSALPTAPPPAPPRAPPHGGDWRLLLYRAEDGPRHWELDPATDAVLGAFEAGATVAEAVEAALAVGPEAAAGLGALFHGIATRRALDSRAGGDIARENLR